MKYQEIKMMWKKHIYSVLKHNGQGFIKRSYRDVALSKFTPFQKDLILSDKYLFNSFVRAISPLPVSFAIFKIAENEQITWHVEIMKKHIEYSIRFFNDYPQLKIERQNVSKHADNISQQDSRLSA